MDACLRRAHAMYKADGMILSHERDAHRLGAFLTARLREQPPGPQRDAAVVSVVGSLTRVATYFSSGQKSIVLALAHLLRLVQPHHAHPDYDPQWRALPLEQGQDTHTDEKRQQR